MTTLRKLFILAVAGLSSWQPLHAQQGPLQSARVIEPKGLTEKHLPPVIAAVSLDRQDRRLATAGDDHAVRLWDLQTGQEIRRLTNHTDWVRSVVFHPQEDLLATAGNDRRVLLWDVGTGRLVGELAQHERAISCLAFSPDGQTLAVAGFENLVRVYHVRGGRLMHSLEAECADMRALAFSPNGELLASGGRNGHVHLWNLTNGQPSAELPSHRRRIRGLEFSADGGQIMSASEDGTVYVADVTTGRQLVNLRHGPGKLFAMTNLGDGRIATAGTSNQIVIWDLATGTETDRLEGHTGTITSLVGREGMLVSAGYDTTIRVWRADENPAADRSTSRPSTTIR